MLDFRKIHFIGIGGISMSALAVLASQSGAWVSGSDREKSRTLEKLARSGLKVYVGHDNSVVASSDLVVYSSAVGDDDPELKFARTNRIRCMERKAFLALMAKECKTCVAIAGSHGKTTTTAMLCWALGNLGVAFRGHVGGIVNGIGANYADNGKDVFVTEACEYKRSFLALEPTIGVILNSAYDHPDTYPVKEDMYAAFKQFAEQSQVVLAEENAARTTDLFSIENARDKIYTFGLSGNADFTAADISEDRGKFGFTALFRGQKIARVNLSVYGRHNVLNALAALAVCRLMWQDASQAGKYLEDFKGVKRRFEYMGKCPGGADVIADYAHHPDEICSAIDTVRLMTKGRIVAVFEPHTYSRTKALLKEFAHCFFWTDELIILPTYSARENKDQGLDGIELACYINQGGECALYMDDYDKAYDYIVRHTGGEDVVLVLGAGSVYSLAEKLVEKMEKRH